VEHHFFWLEVSLLEPGECPMDVLHLLVTYGGSFSLGLAVTPKIEHEHAVASSGVDGSGLQDVLTRLAALKTVHQYYRLGWVVPGYPPPLQVEPVGAFEAYFLEVEALVSWSLLDWLADGGGEPSRHEQSEAHVPQAQYDEREQAPAKCVLYGSDLLSCGYLPLSR
jgi:hypothetical protein